MGDAELDRIGSDMEEGGLDLTLPFQPIGAYAADRQAMLEQCFQVLGEKKLQKMLPDELKVTLRCAALVMEQRSLRDRCFYQERLTAIYTHIQTMYTHIHTIYTHIHTVYTHIHTLIHTFTPFKHTFKAFIHTFKPLIHTFKRFIHTSSSGAVGARRLAQGHLSEMEPATVRFQVNLLYLSYNATNSWNKLPEDSRLAPTLTTFKTKLKTFMFALAFC